MPSDEDLKDIRKRILADFQVQRGTNAWAPWGKSGWSAVEVRNPQRKWAQVHRVKPATGERSGKTTGKVRKDKLVKRDPKLKGKDRPEFSPDEVFAKIDEYVEEQKKVKEAAKDAPTKPGDRVQWASGADIGTWRETPEQRHARLHPPGWKPDSEKTPEELAAQQKKLEELLDLLGDDSTDSDW